MKYYVGVDGGGTKTELVWTDETGRVVLKERLGGSNPNDIGKEKMLRLLTDAIRQKLPFDAEAVDIGMGLSGLGFAGCKEELIAALKKIDKVGAVDVCSDVQIALDSAYDGDGCIVIVGTGSVGYLRKNGNCRLIGGGGYMIDLSLSGYDLGREVLNAVLSEADGRGEKTLLTELFEAQQNTSVGQIVKEVYLRGKAFVASFAPLVFLGYEQNDLVATRILKKCVSDFESLLLGVYRVYGAERCEITLFGGLSKRWEVLSSFLSEEVKEKISFRRATIPVVYGALKRIVKESGGKFLSNFLKSYAAYENK
ncbi:MAG: ROK family protein [Clostridia bacterium]|nr:ROK family protein [Clostridia bacterium]